MLLWILRKTFSVKYVSLYYYILFKPVNEIKSHIPNETDPLWEFHLHLSQIPDFEQKAVKERKNEQTPNVSKY
jgi:hypothetical protein